MIDEPIGEICWPAHDKLPGDTLGFSEGDVITVNTRFKEMDIGESKYILPASTINMEYGNRPGQIIVKENGAVYLNEN